ncbi:MAG: sulfite exporter TauE/SafE family protein [Rikenellaceae bacterium]|jgi:uncharacterized membrane protein YfcA|nr:sulfite exporter TauE/SafE family protein [Rikenellaceae bacterium]
MWQNLTYEIVAILLVSGFMVGFINTLAGGASIISITTFMVLGLPITAANETNRLPVAFSNIAAAVNFRRNKQLNLKIGLRLAVPAIVGNILGSLIAMKVDEQIIRICLGVVLSIILVFMLLSTERRLRKASGEVRIRPIDYVWFLLIGVYGGYIYVGLGYMVLAVALMSMRMDIVAANAMKTFVLAVSTPFALALFMLNGTVVYTFGLIHAAGNTLGAFVASQYAVGWGVKFLKIFLIAVILGCIADVLGVINLHALLLKLV